MKGFSAVRKASQELTDRKNSGGGNFAKELWPALRNSGDSVVVRFLEQGEDVHVGWMHEYQDGNRRKYVLCLDEEDQGVPCPGCESQVKRTIRGFVNVIQRDAPQFETDENGRAKKNTAGQYIVTGTADEVVVWSQGITVFEDLADKDVKYRGLGSRDFEVTRRGSGLNTKYSIEPVLDEEGNAKAVPLSAKDKKLAENKYDIESIYMKKLSYEDFQRAASGSKASGVTESDVEQTREAGSPFGRSRANRFLND